MVWPLSCKRKEKADGHRTTGRNIKRGQTGIPCSILTSIFWRNRSDKRPTGNSHTSARIIRRWALPVLIVLLSIVQVAAEEEESATPVACAISVMLLGSITFQMLIFYLVNNPDDDIKLYSWQVISSTISIFCAVLTFQAVNGLVETHMIEGLEESHVAAFTGMLFGEASWPVVVDIMQLLFWLTGLQLVLAITSGAVGDPPIEGMEGDDDKKKMEVVELNMKSYSVLFAHITGFASINAWGSIQQVYFRNTGWAFLAALPIGLVGLLILYFSFDMIRWKVSMSDDGEVDEYEEKWDEETEEAEDDVIGISLSFLSVQVLRFCISGVFPNQEGVEPFEEGRSHSGKESVTLLLSAFFWFGCSIGIVRVRDKVPENFERLERVCKMASNYFTFMTSWCFFYASRWWMSGLQFTTENALLQVCTALFLSAASFAFIWVLDKIRDSEIMGEESESAIELMISGLGILVGFSWEQSFDVAVAVVATYGKDRIPPGISRLLMSMFLVLIVFPAWRIYILKTEQELIAEMNSDEGKKKKLLKEWLEEHNEYFLSEETDEKTLDLAHLKLKQRRRHMNHKHPHHLKGLTRLMVTAHGVKTVEEDHEHHTHGKHRRTTGALQQRLLNDEDKTAHTFRTTAVAVQGINRLSP